MKSVLMLIWKYTRLWRQSSSRDSAHATDVVMRGLIRDPFLGHFVPLGSAKRRGFSVLPSTIPTHHANIWLLAHPSR